MSVSIIWKLSEKEKENQITFENVFVVEMTIPMYLKCRFFVSIS